MSVVVIGDRKVNKTSMVIALAAPGTKQVKIINPDPKSLVRQNSDPDKGTVAGTTEMKIGKNCEQ